MLKPRPGFILQICLTDGTLWWFELSLFQDSCPNCRGFGDTYCRPKGKREWRARQKKIAENTRIYQEYKAKYGENA